MTIFLYKTTEPFGCTTASNALRGIVRIYKDRNIYVVGGKNSHCLTKRQNSIKNHKKNQKHSELTFHRIQKRDVQRVECPVFLFFLILSLSLEDFFSSSFFKEIKYRNQLHMFYQWIFPSKLSHTCFLLHRRCKIQK